MRVKKLSVKHWLNNFTLPKLILGIKCDLCDDICVVFCFTHVSWEGSTCTHEGHTLKLLLRGNLFGLSIATGPISFGSQLNYLLLPNAIYSSYYCYGVREKKRKLNLGVI